MTNIGTYIDSKGLFDGRYKLIKLLSREGGTADVWLAEDTDTSEQHLTENDEIQKVEGTGVKVAIKIYRPKNMLDAEGEYLFRKEFKTVYECHHENLLKPTGYAVRKDVPYLVMPFCPKGSVEKFIGKLTDKDEIWRFLFHVASGLAYLHTCDPPIIHQDIKPANILIDSNNYYCITDFGISVCTGLDDDYLDDVSSGTIMYMPPERFQEGYVPMSESDIWSLGATVYELVTGNAPFGAEGGVKQKKNAKIPEIKTAVPKGIKKIIYACLDYDPKKRPTARQLAEIARTNGRKHTLMHVTLAFIVVLVCVGITVWQLSAPKPIDQFTSLCNSADSIISIEKDNAEKLEPVEGRQSLQRLKEASLIYQKACREKTDNFKKDSVCKRIIAIQRLLPSFTLYKGVCDTLDFATRNDMPEQIKQYSYKRDVTSDIIKQKIKDL